MPFWIWYLFFFLISVLFHKYNVSRNSDVAQNHTANGPPEISGRAPRGLSAETNRTRRPRPRVGRDIPPTRSTRLCGRRPHSHVTFDAIQNARIARVPARSSVVTVVGMKTRRDYLGSRRSIWRLSRSTGGSNYLLFRGSRHPGINEPLILRGDTKRPGGTAAISA